MEGHQMPSREPGYSGCLMLEDVWDDSTDLAGPNEVEQFNLASGSFSSGKLVLQQLMQGGDCCPSLQAANLWKPPEITGG